MADPTFRQGLMPSIVDRLVDPESAGSAARRGYSLEQMIVAVRRDLEELLNTRESFPDFSREFPELAASVLTFGLPDLTYANPEDLAKRGEINNIIELAIERFEPRLRNVRVQMVDDFDERRPVVRFHIDAQLRADPAPEVGFETTLELTTGHASIRQSR